MKDTALPAFYSKALLQVASKHKTEDNDLRDLQNVLSVLEQNQPLHYFLLAPVSSRHEKRRILQRLFENKVADHILAFLGKLADQARIGLLLEIIIKYSQALQQHKGIININLIVPEALDEKNRSTLQAKLQASYGNMLELHEKVDPRIIGGMILQFPHNKILDYSLKTKLNRLKSVLK